MQPCCRPFDADVNSLKFSDPVFRFGRAVRRGLTPITIGLMFSGASILARAVNHDWRGYAITLLTVAVVLRKPLNPLWLLGAGAVAGILGIV